MYPSACLPICLAVCPSVFDPRVGLREEDSSGLPSNSERQNKIERGRSLKSTKQKGYQTRDASWERHFKMQKQKQKQMKKTAIHVLRRFEEASRYTTDRPL